MTFARQAPPKPVRKRNSGRTDSRPLSPDRMRSGHDTGVGNSELREAEAFSQFDDAAEVIELVDTAQVEKEELSLPTADLELGVRQVQPGIELGARSSLRLDQSEGALPATGEHVPAGKAWATA